MDRPDWAPEGIDVNVPNAARMYDYALGGYHNFAVDRELVERAEATIPGASLTAHANRAFLGRVVRWLTAHGVRQFLDIGSGIPTLGSVHEIAQEAAADSRVIYVDIDPVAVAHSEAILAGRPGVGVVQADLRSVAEILSHRRVSELLDFSQPVAVLLIAVLHFIPDSDGPEGIVAQLRDVLAPGSYVVVSHGTPVDQRAEDAEAIRRIYERTPTRLHLRTPDQVATLLAGTDLVEPGVVPVTDWHPEPGETANALQAAVLAAVGRTR